MMQPLDFADFTDRILALYSAPRYARKTYLRTRQVLRELAALGLETTADLTTARMGEYARSKGRDANPNTVNGLLGSAAALCAVAVEEGWLDRPPAWRRVRPRAAPMTLNAPGGYAEVGRLLEHVHAARGRSWEAHRLCALVWLVALTGVRLGEAQHAWVEDLEVAPGSAAFRVNPARHRLKTARSDRVIPLPSILAAVLAPWRDSAGPTWLFPGSRRRGPWTGGEGGRSKCLDHLRAAAREAGIGQLTWHSLRHAFATAALVKWELPPWVVQRVMGHADIRTTMRYLHAEGAPEIAAAMGPVRYRADPAHPGPLPSPGGSGPGYARSIGTTRPGGATRPGSPT